MSEWHSNLASLFRYLKGMFSSHIVSSHIATELPYKAIHPPFFKMPIYEHPSPPAPLSIPSSSHLKSHTTSTKYSRGIKLPRRILSNKSMHACQNHSPHPSIHPDCQLVNFLRSHLASEPHLLLSPRLQPPSHRVEFLYNPPSLPTSRRAIRALRHGLVEYLSFPTYRRYRFAIVAVLLRWCAL